MLAWVSNLVWGDEDEDTSTSSPSRSKASRVIPTLPRSPSTSSGATTPGGEETSVVSSRALPIDYSGARSIVVAALLESLTDDAIDTIIEEHEEVTGSQEELAIEELEELILKRVEEEEPVEDIFKAQPHLEFDLSGMTQEELAVTYREQVGDLFSLGSEVVGRTIDYADVEAIIGHSPHPPFGVEAAENEFHKLGKEYDLGEWGMFNCSLRATLLLLAYQHSDLDTAGAILRLLRHMFRQNADPKFDFDDLDKFVEFARMTIYDESAEIGDVDVDEDGEEGNDDMDGEEFEEGEESDQDFYNTDDVDHLFDDLDEEDVNPADPAEITLR